jgi:hypothetical protein
MEETIKAILNLQFRYIYTYRERKRRNRPTSASEAIAGKAVNCGICVNIWTAFQV